MEAVPKVHRHRYRRSSARRHQERNSSSNNSEVTAEATNTTTSSPPPQPTTMAPTPNTRNTRRSSSLIVAEEGLAGGGCNNTPPEIAATHTRLLRQNERNDSAAETSEAVADAAAAETPSQCSSSPQTVVLVNGHSLPDHDVVNAVDADANTLEDTADKANCSSSNNKETLDTTRAESPQPNANGGSSRNSSGDALSLRETLLQLQPCAVVNSGSSGGHHHHRRRSSHSPQSPASRRARSDEPPPDVSTSYFHRGIIGFMDREIKTGSGGQATSPTPSSTGATKKLQSLSDPQASPAQRSTRSRSSLEKSPRRKRSKSESRRRRERKLIAAGEMEVRQANETLMRYLKQCSEMNDASLSGELEIDKNFDERRVHRKTKSQRDKRGHLISKLYTAGGLSSLLKELSDDIVPAEGEEIYNPFTPVVSPTEDAPAHIEKMFVQTSSGYRPVDHCYYKHSFVGASRGMGAGSSTAAGASGGTPLGGSGGRGSLGGMSGDMRGSFSDTRCLLDAQCRSSEISTNLHLACVVQRIWLLVSNICHGLLAGLALTHLLFVITSHPMDLTKYITDVSLAGEASQQHELQKLQQQMTTTIDPSAGYDSGGGNAGGDSDTKNLYSEESMMLMTDYAAFAEIYTNTFYCLAIVCLVSVFDRMDICHLDLSNAAELVSFRWIIIAMIYIATIILSICSNSIDEKLYFNRTANVTLMQQQLLSNQVLSVWNSLSVARSLGAIFGWLMIGLTPHDDRLYEHLLDLARYQPTN